MEAGHHGARRPVWCDQHDISGEGGVMPSVIGTIAEWCAGNNAFSVGARRSAQQAIVDTVGCMIAGVDDFSTTAVRNAFQDQIAKTGTAAVIGGDRSSASVAALINGTAAHAVDYD